MQPDATIAATQPELWMDSGFGGPGHMDASHQPLVDAVKELPFTGSVLDLGSGSGTLLEKLAAGREGIVMYGVEMDEQRAARSQARLPHARIAAGSMFGPTWEEARYGLVILMPGRLMAVDETTRAAFLRKLHSRADHVLLYAYGDWLEKYDSVLHLAKEAGLSFDEVLESRTGPCSEALLVRLRGQRAPGPSILRAPSPRQGSLPRCR